MVLCSRMSKRREPFSRNCTLTLIPGCDFGKAQRLLRGKVEMLNSEQMEVTHDGRRRNVVCSPLDSHT